MKQNMRTTGTMTRCALALLVSIVCLVISSSAAATTQYFAEVVTSEDAFFLPSDTTTSLTSDTVASLATIFNDGQVEGAGIGDGSMSAGDTLVYNHTFEMPTNASIISASLAVAVVDKHWRTSSDDVTIDVNGASWADGSTWLSIMSGGITAGISEVGGQLQITIMATQGNFDLVGTLFRVAYEIPDTGSSIGEDVSAVPEPGAMALFYAGIVVFGSTRKRVFRA
jgi:hypothetical protein